MRDDTRADAESDIKNDRTNDKRAIVSINVRRTPEFCYAASGDLY